MNQMNTAGTVEQHKDTLCRLLNDKKYTPMKASDIAYILEVPQQEREHFMHMLEELEDEGRVVKTGRGRYAAPARLNMVYGEFSKSTRGFGFVRPEDGTADIFIPGDEIRGARHRDRVLCQLLHDGEERDGTVIRIISHGISNIVGTYQIDKGGGYVVPDVQRLGKRIFIKHGQNKGAADGSKVCVNILREMGHDTYEGEITRILGHKDDPGIDIMSILVRDEIPVEFPDAVMEEAQKIPDYVMKTELEGREDFRDTLMVTIDGADSKDLDDAVSLVHLANGNYQLGVYIADVAHYVRRGTAIYKEAVRRGTSIYLTDRVIPMLPRRLSNGICSLNEGVDRLALCCIMEVDGEGKVVKHRISEGVINVDHRMTYDVVNEMITDSQSPYRQQYDDIAGMLDDMNELRAIFYDKRTKRGGIEFDFTESKIIVDENGKPTAIEARKRNDATNLIEEFMIACNEVVAEDYFWQGLPFVYRTHEEPDGEKLEALGELVHPLGFRFRLRKKDVLRPIIDLLKQAEDSPESFLINRMVLRSMKQAVYSTNNAGHFGLGSKYYCHFTSPIRRLPDLLIHSVIKDNLHGLAENVLEQYQEKLPDLSRQASKLERRAEQLEREVDKLKKAQFMEDKVGEIYDGIISGVTGYGIYVELENTIEGMVSLADIHDDYYIFDQQQMEVRGERSHRVYRLGMKVKIRVARADGQSGQIDFTFDIDSKIEKPKPIVKADSKPTTEAKNKPNRFKAKTLPKMAAKSKTAPGASAKAKAKADKPKAAVRRTKRSGRKR